jgi:hypothetical protein
LTGFLTSKLMKFVLSLFFGGKKKWVKKNQVIF